jgi:hypothetical protein
MPKQASLGDRLLVDGADLSGDVNAIGNLSSPRPTVDATGINSLASEVFLMRGDGRIGLTAFFNADSARAHPILSALPTGDVLVSYLRSTLRGNPAACLVAKQIDYAGTKGADGSLTFQVEAQANAVALEWARQITAGEETHASATSSPGLDERPAGSTALGGSGYVHVREVGSGTPTFLLEDSADSTDGLDGTWAALISFGAIATRQAVRGTVTGNVDRWLRATTTGTFTDADFVMAFRRGEANDDVDLS